MNEQVKDYIGKYPSEIIDMYNNLRQLIFESVSCEPEETLWAKLPSYYIGESFVRLIPFKDHINIEAQAVIQHKEELAGYKVTPKGMVQIYLKQDIPYEVLKQIFAETLGGKPTNDALEALIGANTLDIWDRLTEHIDQLYDMDRIWDKGFKDWNYEYKYRRGGKTLCTFYARSNVANILIVLGKSEREKFEMQRESFTEQTLALYDATESLHDGKWLWIPINENLSFDDVLRMLKIKRKPNRK